MRRVLEWCWRNARGPSHRTRQVCPFYSILEMFCMFVLDIIRPAETDVRHARLVPARGAPAVFVRVLRSHTFDRFGRIAQARVVHFGCCLYSQKRVVQNDKTGSHDCL